MEHNLLNPFGQVIIVICLNHDFIHCGPCGEVMRNKSAKRYYLLLGGQCGQVIRINILKHELVLCGLCGEVERSKPVDNCAHRPKTNGRCSLGKLLVLETKL